MTDPAFSVIVPAYNAPRTIESTVRSALAQTRTDLEVIVVDDGSSDNTPRLVERIAEQDPRVVLIEQPNGGTAAARNRGVQAARGRMLSLLDNDDLWLPRYLEVVAPALESDPENGFAYSDGWILDDATGRVNRSKAFECHPPQPHRFGGPELISALLDRNFVMASACSFTREAIEAAGPFDASPDVVGSDDLDMWLRMAKAGYQAVRVDEPLAVYRERADSVSKDTVMMYEKVRGVIERGAEGAEPNSEVRRTADRRLAELNAQIEALSSEGAADRTLREARRHAGRLKRALKREWRPAPSELRAALPDFEFDTPRASP